MFVASSRVETSFGIRIICSVHGFHNYFTPLSSKRQLPRRREISAAPRQSAPIDRARFINRAHGYAVALAYMLWMLGHMPVVYPFIGFIAGLTILCTVKYVATERALHRALADRQAKLQEMLNDAA